MSTIKKILVALDGSKNSYRALTKAIDFAKQTKVPITGIVVVQTYRTEMGVVKTITGEIMSKNIKKIMNVAKKKCYKNKIQFSGVTKYGQEGNTIVSYAEKNGYDIIVIGSRGRGLFKEILLGSTSHHVVHSSKIPVLIIK
jgi:nucleotide-binding universal stress UspA family protein